MKLLNLHSKVKQLLWLLSKPENQWDYYDMQKAAVQALTIRNEWRFIQEYHELEAENAMQALANPKTPKELTSYYQAKYSYAVSFLDRLDAMKAD